MPPKAAAATPEPAPKLTTRVKVRVLQTGYLDNRLYEPEQEFLMPVTAMKPAPGNHGDAIVKTKDGEFALPFWVEDAKIVREAPPEEGDGITDDSNDVI